MRIGKEVLILNLDDVLPNRFQPRITFDEKAIMELTESIKEHGVIQPIVVRRVADKYEIIAGERRYKASVLAGKKSIPAILADLNDRDSAEVALIENVQRQDLTPIEEAISYKKILDMGYLNQVDLANKLGKTQSTIANKLRLLNLCDEVQEALMKEKISERHARSLLKLNKEQQKIMLAKIISERLTVRKTDEEIEKMLNNNSSSEEDNGEEKIKNTEENNINKIEENKGENKMNNNSQDINNFNIQSSPIFPGFATTNIEESQPINFNTNEINQPQQPVEQQNNISTTSLSQDTQNISNMEQAQEPNYSNIFGQVQPSEPIQNNVAEPTNIFEQNMAPQNENNSQSFMNNNEQINNQEENIKPEENKFFGLFNNANLNDPAPNIFSTQQVPVQTQEQPVNSNIFGQVQTNEPMQNNVSEPTNIFETQQVEEPINQVQQNNIFGTQNTTNIEHQAIQEQNKNMNNIFGQISNQTQNVEPQNNLIQPEVAVTEPTTFEPIQPVIEPQIENNKIEPVIQPAIEELNFDEEIKPVQPFTLDDNQNFNNQNSQILSQSSSPVAIITPKEIPELQPIMPEQEQTKYGTINDMINIIRNSIDKVEANGYIVDSDEMDLQNSYQIVITIEK